MKKIVGILAAVAMASSVFAVDFTAGMQLKADFFNYNTDSGAMDVVKVWHENSKDDKPFIFTISDDRAGGTLKICDVGDISSIKWADDNDDGIVDPDELSKQTTSGNFEAKYWNIWFKPFDFLKVNLGNCDIKLNCETVTYWRGKIWGAGDFGAQVSYEADGLTVMLGESAGNNAAWLSKANKDADMAKKETYVYVAYNADFGGIKAVADFDWGAKYMDVPGADLKQFGAGYNGSAGSLSYFADVLYVMYDFGYADGSGMKFDADVKYSQDALSAEAYVGYNIPDFDADSEFYTMPCYAKVAYNLDAGTAFFKFEDEDLGADDFAARLILGFDGNMGCMSYEVAAQYDCAAKTISMPCWFRIGF